MKRLISLLMMMTALSSVAMAGTVTLCDTIELTTIDDINLVIPAFDETEHALTGVDVVLNVTITGDAHGENTGNCFAGGCEWSFWQDASFAGTDLDGTPLYASDHVELGGTIDSYDGIMDFGGASGYTVAFPEWTPFSDFHLNATDLATFYTPTSFVLDEETLGSQTTPGNGSYGWSTFMEASICVTYTFDSTVATEEITWDTLKANYR